MAVHEGSLIHLSGDELMFRFIQIVTITLVAIAMAPPLAHAFEFPGKLRLSRDAYMTVQMIYYPGFTLLGVSEPLGLLAIIAQLLLTPLRGTALWLTVVALLGLVSMQLLYWTRTHPANKFWLQNADKDLGKVGEGFFAFELMGPPISQTTQREMDWRKLRDRWEYSHVARAGVAFISFISLLIAIVLQD
jgi:hypothetical protein